MPVNNRACEALTHRRYTPTGADCFRAQPSVVRREVATGIPASRRRWTGCPSAVAHRDVRERPYLCPWRAAPGIPASRDDGQDVRVPWRTRTCESGRTYVPGAPLPASLPPGDDGQDVRVPRSTGMCESGRTYVPGAPLPASLPPATYLRPCRQKNGRRSARQMPTACFLEKLLAGTL